MRNRKSRASVSDRALHLVDLDNLVGGPGHPEAVPEAIERYLRASGFRAEDHLVVAADASLARTAVFQMPPGTRFLVGRGRNGADQRLIDAVPVAHIARRYGRLVIGSGDHAFEGLLWELRRRGVPVLVVGRTHSIARRLTRVADARRGVLVHVLPPIMQRAAGACAAT